MADSYEHGNIRNFLSCCATVGFLRRTRLHGVIFPFMSQNYCPIAALGTGSQNIRMWMIKQLQYLLLHLLRKCLYTQSSVNPRTRNNCAVTPHLVHTCSDLPLTSCCNCWLAAIRKWQFVGVPSNCINLPPYIIQNGFRGWTFPKNALADRNTSLEFEFQYAERYEMRSTKRAWEW